MKKALVFILIVLFPALAMATPNSISVTGSLTHGSAKTITGLEFGTKSPAAPLIWDNCENGTVGSHSAVVGAGTGAVRNDGRTGWDQSEPGGSNPPTDSDYEVQYRTSWASIPQAHSKSTKYLAGGHYEDCGVGGPCNLCYVGVSLASDYDRWFVMYYLRLPDEWNDVPVNGPNYKEFRIGTAGCNESDACSCYYAHASDPNSVFTGTANILLDGNCSECSGGGWGDMLAPNPALAWRHREMRAENIDGYLSIKTANVEATGGPVDCDASETLTSRGTIGNWNIGGYGRALLDGGTTDNRMKRFWDDLYIDTTWSRVMLCNDETYEDATICEPQIPSAWSTTSITVTANLGALTGTKAYLFVFDSDNNANATGYEVTLGGTTLPSTQGCTISGGAFK